MVNVCEVEVAVNVADRGCQVLFLFSFRAISGPILLRQFCLGGKCMATPHRRPYLRGFSYAIVTDISSRMTRIKVSKSMGYTKPFGLGD
jgi:hypothetical protein